MKGPLVQDFGEARTCRGLTLGGDEPRPLALPVPITVWLATIVPFQPPHRFAEIPWGSTAAVEELETWNGPQR